MKQYQKKAALFLLLLAVPLVVFAAGQQAEAGGASETVSVIQDGGMNQRLVKDDVEITVMLSESNLVPISQDMTHFKWMYETTGIRIVFMPVPSADYKQKKSALLATNNLPDIIQLNQNDINNYADTGILVDLSKYADKLPDFYDRVEEYPEAKFTFIDGKPFGFPVLNRWNLDRGSALVARKDIMDELGLGAPKTFTDFYNMLKAFKQAYPDSSPFIARKGSTNMMSKLGYALGSGHTIMFDPQQGKYLYQPAKQETKQVLEYLKSMWDEGLLDSDYISVSNTQWQEKMANNTGFAYLDNVGYALRSLPALIDGGETDAEWICLTTPVNEFGYSRALYYSPHQLDKIYGISSSSKVIDEAVDMFNWLYTDEVCSRMNLGVEGVDYELQPNGELNFTEETLKKYSDENGKFVKTLMHKERGNAAYESFIVYSDIHSYFLATDPVQMDWYVNVIQKDPAFTNPLPTPPFTQNEREQVTSTLTMLNTIATEMFDKLIMGVDPIDSFDLYVERFQAAGLEKLESIYNTAYERIK